MAKGIAEKSWESRRIEALQAQLNVFADRLHRALGEMQKLADARGPARPPKAKVQATKAPQKRSPAQPTSPARGGKSPQPQRSLRRRG